MPLGSPWLVRLVIIATSTGVPSEAPEQQRRQHILLPFAAGLRNVMPHGSRAVRQHARRGVDLEKTYLSVEYKGRLGEGLLRFTHFLDSRGESLQQLGRSARRVDNRSHSHMLCTSCLSELSPA